MDRRYLVTLAVPLIVALSAEPGIGQSAAQARAAKSLPAQPAPIPLGTPSAAPSAPKLHPAEVSAWRQDLRYMAAEMARHHRNLYHTVSKKAFDRAVSSLDARLPTLQRHQIILEMARIVAMVGDGHTNIAPTRDPKIGFRSYPIRLYFFRDGLFIRAADSAHARLVGARVRRIGRATVEEAYVAVRPLIGRDNEMGARFFAPFLLAMPEVLEGLGLVPDMEHARFVLEQDGRTFETALTPAGPAELMARDTDRSWAPVPGWVDARGADSTLWPLWLRHPERNFCYAYLDSARTLYVQYNQIADEEHQTVEQFSRRLFAFAASHPVERLVFDLRLNAGGNGALNRPLLLGIIRAESLDVRGRLFAIIGRRTWSAAQFFVTQLENWTEVTFVGEPTASRGNAYGDSYRITLPNSGITVRVSSLYWQLSDPRDRRPWTAPEVAAELGFEDYRRNRDPALEAVLAYRPEPSLADLLRAVAEHGDSAISAAYHAYRNDPRHRYVDTEIPANNLGYEWLEAGRTAEALTVLRLNAQLYPRSANAHDSYAEALAAAGDTAAAIREYRAALRLDPSLSGSADKLQALTAGDGQ